ncbi:SEC-C metal-binding domain-containing protein [Cohnella cholangitidis]|uniref:Tetratricopeptide repeat protein n=1 Tax=Cohnella cholangitidis TaxID=2598458 RepID=A0A7G5C0E5_9BACL|nr:SEC-C metal-binding domain-containing protein [Cohnella cholangitidis]QMV42679.1 tetratricopeptide repeat protein [Cohnella cholangitidis]
MQKLGRNDPCHCGSGLKYKKCCLSKDEAGNVTRLTQPNPKPMTPLDIIETELTWANELHKQIAIYFFNNTYDLYENREIVAVIRMWHDYATAIVPIAKKIGVYPAALEYILGQVYGYEITQSSLADKYGVSVGTLSQRANQIFDYLDEHLSEFPISPSGPNASADPQSRMKMEQEMLRVHALLEEQNFGTIEEANAFVQNMMTTQQPKGTAKRKSPGKLEQAAEILYAAWDEPNPKQRIKLAQEALLLDPNSVDAYNILAESAAATPKDMAFYYKQGMMVGEKHLGEAFFKENKGHFWGYLPTRPYMRAKKGYAEACAEMGNLTEAIKHYRELLELNPNDNQGVRELLLSAYIETLEWKDAAALIKQFDVDESAAFNYNRILVEYGMNGKSSKLSPLIKKAVAHNPYVSAYLQGKKRLPREMPEYIGYGDDPEAIVYAQIHRHLWLIRPELLQLLPEGKNPR